MVSRGLERYTITGVYLCPVAYDVSTDYIIGHFPLPLPAPSTESEYELYRKVSQMSEEELVGLFKRLKEEKANLEDITA